MRRPPRSAPALASVSLPLALFLLLLLLPGCGEKPDPLPRSVPMPIKTGKGKKPDVPYMPMPPEAVDRILALAGVKQGDVVYDLGCGDGRVLVAAARRYGVKAVGIDIDPARVKEARENAARNGVADLVRVEQKDLFETDISDATVVTLFLFPTLNVKLMPKLARLRPGTRVVSYSFDMKGAKPAKVEQVVMPDGGERPLYLWVVPWEAE